MGDIGPLHTKPVWQIERVLGALVDCDVRVRVRSFSPILDSARAPRFTSTDSLVLPDGSCAENIPVHFEGVLKGFRREGGVVFVELGSRLTKDAAPESRILFRHRVAAIIGGPAVVELAVPFQVERVPTNALNYWRDLRVPHAQLILEL